MLSIPPYVYLIGALIAWCGLILTWAKHIREVSEQRRLKAVQRGETAPDIKGVSNYERAELRESAHRALQVTTKDKWIGHALLFGIPLIIITVFSTKTLF